MGETRAQSQTRAVGETRAQSQTRAVGETRAQSQTRAVGETRGLSETRALSEWAAAAALGDLPEGVVHDTKRLILDQLGCQVGCARLPWSRTVLGAVRDLSGSGPATVVVFGDRLPADEAAFVNSVFAHGNEIDDAHIDFRTHPGSVVIPAALAASQAGRNARAG